MKRIAVFASGNGSNAENIIRHFNREGSNAEVVLVVCNRPEAGVIGRAWRLGVTTAVMSRDSLRTPAAILPLLEASGVDLIVLAGYLLMVPDFLLARYPGRIVNIHPSLLPKFGGKGMYGANVHKAVVEAGESVTGITIHYVSDSCDEGEVIFQAEVAVDPADTPADVERKVHELEREHFPQVIARIVDNIEFSES